MKATMFLTTLFLAAILRADPPEQTWIECDALNDCPEQMTCVKFDDMPTAVCWPADQDPCEYCGTAECAVAESYPPQVSCGDGEVPDTDPLTCVSDEDCPEEMFCFSGYCVDEGDPATETTCKNEAGYCVIGETSGYCQCVTGAGVGWGEAEPGEPTDPVEDGDGDGEVPPPPFFLPTSDECMAMLVENCGETAPDLKEECGDKFDVCYDGVTLVTDKCMTPLTVEEKESLMTGAWIGEASQMLYQCCQEGTLEELTAEMTEIEECLDAGSCEECLGGGDDPTPLTPCAENGDCPDGGTCKDGTCYWTTESGDETTTNPADQPKDDTGDDQTGGEDYTNTAGDGTEEGTTAPRKESDGSGCSMVLI
ncbi:MAG TPA: hypothetical protein P5077_05570 [bacterium]|nr:hypothetical protein [bacterium]